MARIDEVFPGFHRGDFAVLFGHSLCRKLLFLLCVRCQLPAGKGGLNSKVVYIDGGNTFDPYSISAIAQEHGLHPKSVLESILISRAFTAYQSTALVLDKLEAALKSYKPKLVIVSDITGLFLDRDVPRQEAEHLFKNMTQHLSKLASNKQVIIVAWHIPRSCSRRSRLLKSVLYGNATMVMGVRESKGVSKFILENHPKVKPFTMTLPSNSSTLDMFMEEYGRFLRFFLEKPPGLNAGSVEIPVNMLKKLGTLEDFMGGVTVGENRSIIPSSLRKRD